MEECTLDSFSHKQFNLSLVKVLYKHSVSFHFPASWWIIHDVNTIECVNDWMNSSNVQCWRSPQWHFCIEHHTHVLRVVSCFSVSRLCYNSPEMTMFHIFWLLVWSSGGWCLHQYWKVVGSRHLTGCVWNVWYVLFCFHTQNWNGSKEAPTTEHICTCVIGDAHFNLAVQHLSVYTSGKRMQKPCSAESTAPADNGAVCALQPPAKRSDAKWQEKDGEGEEEQPLSEPIDCGDGWIPMEVVVAAAYCQYLTLVVCLLWYLEWNHRFISIRVTPSSTECM